jgi:hypothetical protein
MGWATSEVRACKSLVWLCCFLHGLPECTLVGMPRLVLLGRLHWGCCSRIFMLAAVVYGGVGWATSFNFTLTIFIIHTLDIGQLGVQCGCRAVGGRLWFCTGVMGRLSRSFSVQ